MVEIDDLTKDYAARRVVDGVSFTVGDGEIAAVVGPSGSGKTTLLRMINRLIEPSSGSVRIDGKDTRAVPPHVLRRGIGYAIQGYGLFPHRTVAQNIATVPRLMGWARARIDARVDALLDLFQLPAAEFRHRMPNSLSGGQQQRVGVARALAAEPNVLLMDEPFGALDPIIRTKAQSDLLAIQRRFGTTIIVVTHDIEEAIHLGSRIAVLDAGKLVQYATPADVIARPATPLVAELIGGDRPFRLLSLGKVVDLVEAGPASGEPIRADASLRDAYAELLWTRRDVLPVIDATGTVVGRIRRDAITVRAGAPS
ncbi:MAG: ABC transporter ATP-binding protein [Burkholderiales bacterium]|nr:ABC transporter ATP-binding protein [Burkholderiales bacterium]